MSSTITVEAPAVEAVVNVSMAKCAACPHKTTWPGCICPNDPRGHVRVPMAARP